MKQKIVAKQAPQAIGSYSQAVRARQTVYLSGQIALESATMAMVNGDIAAEVKQVFSNLQAVCRAAGGELDHIVKLTIYLTDLSCFSLVNETMKHYFQEPYPARSTVQVAALPKSAKIEVDAIMVI